MLVTRPEEEARETALRLEGLHHEAIVAPLIAVRFLAGNELDVDGVQAFLATSSNGVRALARRSRERRCPLFAVGRQTARTARELGFLSVKDADGDARALADLVANALDPAAGVLVHATARDAPGAFAEALVRSGFRVRSEILYETPIVAELPQNAAAAIREGQLDAVLLFSAKTATALRDQAAGAGLAPHCARLRAFCISHACADALSPLVFSRVAVAPAPNQDALLGLLG